jgi:hypothetical protein
VEPGPRDQDGKGVDSGWCVVKVREGVGTARVEQCG